MKGNIYLLDTNAIIKHFCNASNLGKQAGNIIKKAETGNGDILLISIISLMEILYLAEKNRIPITLADTLKWIEKKSCYEIVAFDKDVLITIEKINFYEMHDRIILATAMFYGTPVLSSDKLFTKVKGIDIIW